MKRLSKFHLVAGAAALAGLVAAVVAPVGPAGVAQAFLALAVALVAVALVLADRRAARHGQRPARVPSGVGVQPAPGGGEADARLKDLSKRLELMERRLLSSMDAARYEAAERHRESAS